MCKVCDFANAVCDGRRVAKSCAKSQIAGKVARLEHFAAKSTSLVVLDLEENRNCQAWLASHCRSTTLAHCWDSQLGSDHKLY